MSSTYAELSQQFEYSAYSEPDDHAAGSVDPELLQAALRTAPETHFVGQPQNQNRQLYLMEGQIRPADLTLLSRNLSPLAAALAVRSVDYTADAADKRLLAAASGLVRIIEPLQLVMRRANISLELDDSQLALGLAERRIVGRLQVGETAHRFDGEAVYQATVASFSLADGQVTDRLACSYAPSTAGSRLNYWNRDGLTAPAEAFDGLALVSGDDFEAADTLNAIAGAIAHLQSLA